MIVLSWRRKAVTRRCFPGADCGGWGLEVPMQTGECEADKTCDCYSVVTVASSGWKMDWDSLAKYVG